MNNIFGNILKEQEPNSELEEQEWEEIQDLKVTEAIEFLETLLDKFSDLVDKTDYKLLGIVDSLDSYLLKQYQ